MTVYPALLAIIMAGLFVKGVMRRKATSSRQSWWHFGLAFVGSVVLFAGGVWLELKIGDGPTYGAALAAQFLSHFVLDVVSAAAILAPVFLLGWFAKGEPEGQPWWPLSSSTSTPRTK